MAVILVTARTNSKRLPRKCLASIGGQTVIEHVLQRATDVGIEPVLCTSEDSSDDELSDLVQFRGYRVFRGHTTNKIARWAEAGTSLGSEVVHALDADDPFFDPVEVRESVQLLVSAQLDAVYPSRRSNSGAASVGSSFRLSHLVALTHRIAERLTHDDLDVIPWHLLSDSKDLTRLMPDRDLGVLNTNVRLTLDYVEDLHVLDSIARSLGARASRLEVENFLAQHPEIVDENIFLMEEFHRRQDAQRASFHES